MPDYSMKAKRRAWQRAKEAADAVEAVALGNKGEDAAGGAARQERLLLDRLRDEDHARTVGEAWLRIERHFKNGDEGQRVIRGLLDALTLSKNIVLMPVDYRRSMKHLKELRGFTDQLYVYFTDGIARDPLWMIIAGSRLSNERNFRDIVVSLEGIRSFLAGREEQFSHIFDQIGLTREIKVPVAQRAVFTAALSNAMHNIFGEWLDDVVRILTEVALGVETSIDQVAHARKNAARRRGRTKA
jgi:hypothetical protein